MTRERITLPIFWYFVCVGAVLLAALFAVGESKSPPRKLSIEKGWTPTNSLRSMAHHGEPNNPPRLREAPPDTQPCPRQALEIAAIAKTGFV